MLLNSTKPILIIGDIALDSYWECDTHRISPEAPVPVAHVKAQYTRPGCAANVALNITALGGKATLIGLVGKDNYAKELHTILSDAGVNCQFFPCDKPTINKLRILSQNQQLLRTDFEESFTDVDKSEIVHYLETHLSDYAALILSDYSKGTLSSPQAFIQLAKKVGIPILIDPKGADFSPYKNASLLTPNLKEFTDVVGPINATDELIAKAQLEISNNKLDALLITRGADGMTLVTQDGTAETISTSAKEVFDVTGAGDTVIASLALALTSDLPLSQAMRIANAAAGLVVAKSGTASITQAELQAALSNNPTEHSQTLMPEKLKALLVAQQQLGESIVFTNGCFDLLHAGHVDYLKAAKALGDRLVVAINTDASIKRLKGETRPINTLANRMTVLQALQAVDWVIPFDEDTPLDLINLLQPDILVKGADYQKENIVGADSVINKGGRVETITLTPHCSTTAIINKIRED